MRHHWHELDELLRELDEAARFTSGRPRLAVIGTEEPADGEAEPAPVVPIRRGGDRPA